MKTPRDTLVLVTAAPPGMSLTEEAFLAPELPVLHKSFGRVIRMALNDRIRPMKRIAASAGPVAVKAGLRAVSEGHRVWRANAYGARAALWRDRFARMISNGELDPQRTLFYTFWFDFATVGLALLADRYDLAIVSRAHGYDIREENSAWLRDLTLSRIKALYPACDASTAILHERWPCYTDVIQTARLGSRSPFPASVTDSFDGMTLVSCSRPVEIKRIECVAALAARLARDYDRPVKWIHIGGDDGGLYERCERIVSSAAGLTVEWAGELDNDSVHRLYATRHIDWHILMSRTEGGVPVSIGEAMSYGIPVVATSVGGVPELVVDGVSGLLVSPDVSPSTDDDLIIRTAERIIRVSSDQETYSRIRRGACEIWATRYDAGPLRREFVRNLLRI